MGLLSNLSNLLSALNSDDSSSILKERGDSMDARITESGRKVLRVTKKNGNNYSATQYPNGTTVETKTTRRKK